MAGSVKVLVPPVGAETYRDVLGREQWRVSGPGGKFLVTWDGKPGVEWAVWRPDALSTSFRSTSLQRALDWAAAHVGAEVQR